MLISDSHKFILTMPEKCASSTLYHRLKSIVTVKKFCTGFHYNEDIKEFVSKHIPLELAKKTPEFRERPDHLISCFVRNPYDRVYSWFKWIEKRSQVDAERYTPEELETSMPKLALDLETAEKRRLYQAIEIRKLLETAHYDFNQFLKIAPKQFRTCSPFTHFKGRQVVKFIGYVERFEHDFSIFCEKINYVNTVKASFNAHKEDKGTVPSPLKMSKSEHEYFDHYDSKSIKIVNEHFKEDFALLGYRKHKPAYLRNLWFHR